MLIFVFIYRKLKFIYSYLVDNPRLLRKFAPVIIIAVL